MDATMETTQSIRVDAETKRQASEVARYFGFDLSSVTRAFWRQMARTKSIPLDLTYPEPNDESLESIREADEIIAEGGRRHLKTTDELIASLEA